MTDYKTELKKVTKLPTDKIKGFLQDLPDGLYIGKKIKIGNRIVTYSYTEKEREIMKHLHGLDIDKETMKLIIESN
jgi:hypothetical protein